MDTIERECCGSSCHGEWPRSKKLKQAAAILGISVEQLEKAISPDVKSADGVSGTLCRGIGGTYFFRVYADHEAFTDYEILHNDLNITIDDSDAFFYVTDGQSVLDHSPETLGIKK